MAIAADYRAELPADRLSRPTIRLSEAAASRKLRDVLGDHFARAVAFIESGKTRLAAPEDKSLQAPRLAVAGEAGLGKTVNVIELCAAAAELGVQTGYLVPSLALGAEVHQTALRHGISSRLLRGRDQLDEDGTPMCQRAATARLAAQSGLNVKTTMCRARVKNEAGETVERLCPFYAGCRYMAQQRAPKAPGLVIASHQYLRVESEALSGVDNLVIDESFWNSMLLDTTIDMKAFLYPRCAGAMGPRKGETRRGARSREDEFNFTLQEGIELVGAAFMRATSQGRWLSLGDLRSQGVTASLCRSCRIAEFTRIEQPDIYPDMAEDDQQVRIETLERQTATRFARVWGCLADELETREDDGPVQSLLYEGKKAVKRYRRGQRVEEVEDSVRVLSHVKPKFPLVPTLCIDADADARILGQFFPGIEVVEIRAKWSNVRVRAVHDKSGSKSCFSGSDRRSDEALRLAKTIGARYAALTEKAPSRRPLVVTHMALEEEWLKSGDLAQESSERFSSASPHLAHFGAVRGVDRWKNTAALAVIGRPEPSVDAIETMARQLYHADAEPLQLVEPMEDGRKMLPRQEVSRRDRRGNVVKVMVSYHPDARCDALLRQVRESELLQTIARVRPLRSKDCEVVLATNIPLPIEIDEYVSWSELMPDNFDEAALRGFVPENHRDMADAHPDLFPSQAAAKLAWSRRGDRAEVGDFDQLMAASSNRAHVAGWVRVDFARKDPAKPNARARRRFAWVRLYRDMTEVEVMGLVLGFFPDAVDIRVPETLEDVGLDAEVDLSQDLVPVAEVLEAWDDDEAGPLWAQIPPAMLAAAYRAGAVACPF